MIINSTFIHLLLPGPPGMKSEFGYDNYNWTKKGKFNLIKRDSIYFTKYLLSLKEINVFRENIRINELLSKFSDAESQLLVKEMVLHCQDAAKLDIDQITNISLYRLIGIEPNQRIALKRGEKIISFSRIVYNSNRTKACFYFENKWAGGFGKLVIVEKVKGIWEIKQDVIIWIS